MQLKQQGSASQLQERFKADFLLELPERISAIESVLTGENDNWPDGRFGALYRITHSIKGSAATFGLQILVSICSQFEDVIRESESDSRLLKGFLEIALAYAGLLREAYSEISENCELFERTERKLSELHARTGNRRFTIGLAVNSRLSRDICRKILEPFEARVIEFDDGASALPRVLLEPFHLLIASSELNMLRGEALIAAVKLSEHRNHGVRTLLISASQEKVNFNKRATDADFIVTRDMNFVNNISKICAELYEKYQQLRA